MLSVQYTVHWYGAGAAHPNLHFETFAFALDPLARIHALEDIFSDPSEALKIVQDVTRTQLGAGLFEGDNDDANSFGRGWIERGTDKWSDFSAFVFSENSIDFLFAPYQVASYAEGTKFAEVPYDVIVHLIRPDFKSLLDIEYLLYRESAQQGIQPDGPASGGSAD